MADGRGGEFIKQINTRDRECCAQYVCIIIYGDTATKFNDGTFHKMHWKHMDNRMWLELIQHFSRARGRCIYILCCTHKQELLQCIVCLHTDSPLRFEVE